MNGDARPAADRRIEWAPIVWFILIAYAGAWLVSIPLWTSGRGLAVPWATPLLTLGMFTPALAVLAVGKGLRHEPRLAVSLGLGIGGPANERPARWPLYWVAAWFGVTVIALAAPFVGAAFGLYHLDLAQLSGFRADLGRALHHTPTVTTARLAILTQLAGLLPAVLVNALPALGEELGWRGYLLPRLLPLGRGRALLLSGVVWGLWHTPIVLLGYDYPRQPVLGVLLMVGSTVTFGMLFGWLRLRSRSIWPAVLAHAALNAAAGSTGLFYQQGHPPNAALVGTTGVTGWLLPWLLIAAYLLVRRMRRSRPTDRADTRTGA